MESSLFTNWSNTELVIAGGLVLLSLPLLAFPAVMLMNYSYNRQFRQKAPAKNKKLNLDQIEALFSRQEASQKEIEYAVEVFIQHYAKLPHDKHAGSTKEKFAHHVVMLNYLSQHPNGSKALVQELGNAFIKQNPAYKQDFERKVNSALKMSQK